MCGRQGAVVANRAIVEFSGIARAYADDIAERRRRVAGRVESFEDPRPRCPAHDGCEVPPALVARRPHATVQRMSGPRELGIVNFRGDTGCPPDRGTVATIYGARPDVRPGGHSPVAWRWLGLAPDPCRARFRARRYRVRPAPGRSIEAWPTMASRAGREVLADGNDRDGARLSKEAFVKSLQVYIRSS